MYYEINVSKYGKHFFATAERSCPTQEELRQVYKALSAAFPVSLGYWVTVTEWRKSGKFIDMALDG